MWIYVCVCVYVCMYIYMCIYIPGEGSDTLFQYSCLEDSMDRGAWQAIVHGVTESDMTEHSAYNTHIYTCPSQRDQMRLNSTYIMKEFPVLRQK